MTRFQQYNPEPPAPSEGEGLASVLTGKHRQHLPCFRVDPRLMNPCQDVSERRAWTAGLGPWLSPGFCLILLFDKEGALGLWRMAQDMV